jgi:hypothetical protein
MISNDSPVFIVGCGRSGTTLLRLMLNRSSQIAIPGETWFFKKLLRLWYWNRFFGKEKQRQRIASLISGYDTFPMLGITRADLDEALSQIDPSDPAQVVAVANIAFALRENKPRWGDKTPGYICQLGMLRRLWPRASILHIVRDGRDVALSFMKAPFGPSTPVEAAHYWRRQVLCGLDYGRRLYGDNYMEIRYENLVLHPREELARVCDRIGLSLVDDMLVANEGEQRYLQEQHWLNNAAREIRTDRIEVWRSKMSPEDQKIFWTIAGDVLERLGYSESRPPNEDAAGCTFGDGRGAGRGQRNTGFL